MRGPVYIQNHVGFDLQTDVLLRLEPLLQEPCYKCHLQHFPESTRNIPCFGKDKVIFLYFFQSVSRK